MENIPKISVLMPAYNAEKYISEAIKSILNQTFNEFELIIIDDGSGDKTWEKIKEHAEKDSRIKAFQNEWNMGISPTRNKLINASNCKYIVWQDADDISLPQRLEKQYLFMESNPDVGVCGGFLNFFNEKGLKGTRKYAASDAQIRKTIFRYSPVAQPAAIIRKSCLSELGFFDDAYEAAEDLEIFFRIGTKYKFANLQESLVCYRENATSATYKKLPIIEKQTKKLRKNYSRHPAYSFTVFDRTYNFIQDFVSVLLPPRLKIGLFNLIRNS